MRIQSRSPCNGSQSRRGFEAIASPLVLILAPVLDLSAFLFEVIRDGIGRYNAIDTQFGHYTHSSDHGSTEKSKNAG
jgi:hypothetical protein